MLLTIVTRYLMGRHMGRLQTCRVYFPDELWLYSLVRAFFPGIHKIPVVLWGRF